MEIEEIKINHTSYFEEHLPTYFEIVGNNSEEIIRTQIPSDYLDFIDKFGEGIIADYIRIFPPFRAMRLTEIWKQSKSGYSSAPEEISNKYLNNSSEFIDNSILIGDTLDGDQIIYWEEQYHIFHSTISNWFKTCGSKLLDVLKYYEHGEDGRWEPIEIKTFTPFNSRHVTDSLSGIIGARVY